MVIVVKEFPDLGPPYEECYFCLSPTQFWSVKNDIPVCSKCSKNREESDLPTKEEYMNQEDDPDSSLYD